MSNDSEELRFINNLSVLLSLGRPLRETLLNMQRACRSDAQRSAYDAMLEALDKGGDFTSALADYPSSARGPRWRCWAPPAAPAASRSSCPSWRG